MSSQPIDPPTILPHSDSSTTHPSDHADHADHLDHPPTDAHQPIPHSSPVLAVHQFLAENDDELAFEVGERLVVVEKDEVYGDGWWRGRNEAGVEGLFPASYVEAISNTTNSSAQSKLVQNGGATETPQPSTTNGVKNDNLTTSSGTGFSSLAAAAGITTSNDSSNPTTGPLIPGGGPGPTIESTSNRALDNNNNKDGKEDGKEELPTTPGGTVMKDTIGDIDKAISSIGKKGGIRSSVGGGGGGAVVGSGGGLGVITGNEADDEHAHDLSSDEDDLVNPIWGGAWGSTGAGESKSTRSRLADQARVENERKQREARARAGSVVVREAEKERNASGVRTSGVPAGLMYSDESDDEEETTRQTGVQSVKDQIESASGSPVVSQAEKLPVTTVGSATATEPTPIKTPTTDEEKGETTLSDQVIAAESTAAIGVGAVLGTGIHAAAQAAGLESAPAASGSVPAPSEAPAPVVPSKQMLKDASQPVELASTPPPFAVGSGEARRSSNGNGLESPMGTREFVVPSSEVGGNQDKPPGLLPPQPIVATSMIAPAPSNGFGSPATATTPDTGTKGWTGVPGNPSEWTVEQVQTWARGKGFDEGVVGKFEEHEITGDVLIELDANLLKELDIPQFGKRVKLANAIAELRRPASQGSNSVRSSQQLGGHGHMGRGLFISPGGPSSGQYAYSDGQQSVIQSPMTGGPMASYPTSPNVGFPYQESYRRPYASTPPMDHRDSDPASLTQEDSRRASDATNPQAQGEAAGQTSNIAAGALGAVGAGAAYSEWSHPHIRQPTQSLAKSPIQEEEEAGGQPGPHTATATNSREGTTAGNSDSIRGRTSPIPVSPSTSINPKRSSGGGHKKGKASVDGGKAPSERMSFLGGALGRNRKPAPRYPSSASTVVNNERDDASGHERSRSLKGLISGPGRQGTKHPNAASDSASKRLSTASPDGEDPSTPKSPTVVGNSTAVSQIGSPDFAGYMKKKGERYNSWKNRYFVLKGPHLYYMKDENDTHVKGHIDLAGYKVMTDANSTPGGHGFQIVHEREKSHYFSANDYRVIKDWMKNIMKATITRDYSAPVVSSCNIPTIPLREAQMMSPGPRPPSPSERDATQRATRRDNPNQLTARDASVLMSFDNSPTSPRSPSSPRRSSALARQSSPIALPPRPSREMRKPSDVNMRNSIAMPRKDSDASFYPQSSLGLAPTLSSPTGPATTTTTAATAADNANDAALLSWINSHLPPSTDPATSIPSSFISGRIINRVIEHVCGPSLSPPPPASDDIFIPMASGDANIDGLFMMMDRCIDEGVDTVGVNINDVRLGHGGEIRKLLESLRVWGDSKA